MRKKTISHVADTIFWYLIYFLPVIFYLIFTLSLEPVLTNVINFETYFASVGFGFATDNVVVNTMISLFGVNGVLPIFSTNVPFIIFSWFICTYILHLMVDFLIFIPRLCHKWMKQFTQGE